MFDKSDEFHLAALERKLQLVRDRTLGVAFGYKNGFCLYGPGGVSKSFTVLSELQRLKANYRVSNSRLTGRALFDVLAMYPDATHVLEDCEQLLNDKNAVGVLRSALWGQRQGGDRGPQERWITWGAYNARMEILFTGGLILVGNKAPLDLPELQALKSRIPHMCLQPSDAQMRALMRHIAAKGFEHDGLTLGPDECREVCEFVIAESLSLHFPLNVRLLVNSFLDRLQWSECESGVHWKDMVAAAIRERPVFFKEEVVVGSRAARKAKELEIVREIRAQTNDRHERLRLWTERTGGKSEKSLYRRLAELDDGQLPLSA
jgi:hypothetical protein